MTTNDTNHANTAEHHDEDVPREELHKALNGSTPIWKPVLAIVFLTLAVGGIVAFGSIPKAERREKLLDTAETLAKYGKRVQVGPVRVAAPTRTLTLPASLQANAQADLFAQATGYLRERKVDIGDRVKAGDVLATIDIPLVDEDVNRARASLAEAEAARAEVEKTKALALTTLDRWKNVQPPGAVSQQEIDERKSAYEAAEAAYNAADAVVSTRKAEVQRLDRQKAFGQIVAPFDGTITARNIDVGDYIVSAGPAGAPLFAIADTQTLRVYVDVPQAYAPGIEVGQKASVILREIDGKLPGVVARTSGVLNERTRTLRVEVTLPNENGRVLAGAYGQVQFEVRQTTTPVIVPGAALIVRAEGPRVAIVDADNVLRYVTVVTGRDLGTEVEIVKGLKGDEHVVVNMADELPEGSVVEIVAPAVPPSQATPTTPTSPASNSAKPATNSAK